MAKIRPVSYKDLKDTYGEVKTPLSMSSSLDDSSVESVSIFGDENSVEKEFENLDVYLKRGYIKLAIPVLNFFLAGGHARVMSLILGKDVEAIALGQRYYDLEQDVECSVENIQSGKLYGEHILMGGSYIRWLVDNLDVEQQICIELEKICKKAIKPFLSGLKSEDKGNVLDSMEVDTYGAGGLEILDKYRLYVYGFDIKECEEAFRARFRELLCQELNHRNVRLTYLFSIREDRSVLREQAMEQLIVLPKGFRAVYKKRKHSFTKAYDSIVRVNMELQNLLIRHDTTVSQVRDNYILLVQAVKHLMVQGRNSYDMQYKPLFDILKGKTGLIRDKMQGSRADYTGRSVIVVDPNMSLDTIGIPEGIAESIMEYEEIKQYQTKGMNKSEVLASNKRFTRKHLAKKAIEKTCSVVGRQPTLYNLGIRGFKNKVVEGDAIVLNPLITVAYNADFDGDQMWGSIPLGNKAKQEVKNLLYVENNLFLPRNGECHIAPRMEIIHGLWKASCTKEGKGKKTYDIVHVTGKDGELMDDYEEVLEGVIANKINVYDTVTIDGVTETAGCKAIRACLPEKWRKVRFGVIPITEDANTAEVPVTEKFFKELNKLIALDRKKNFVPAVNKLVRLGFAVSNIFPPSIPVLEYPDVEDLIADFKQKVSEHEKFYNIGLETATAYTTFYDSAYADLEKAVVKRLMGNIQPESGYMEMIKSGARGKSSNIMQIFGMKGRVMKNDVEAFNAIIEKPLVKQLTGLESFITAYGGRQGLIDKSIQTYQPGYLSRKMSHVSSPMYISNEDCGTEEGVLLDYEFIRQFISPAMLTGIDAVDEKALKNYFSDMVIGRFIVGSDRLIETKQDADFIYDKYVADIKNGKLRVKQGVKLRSPITCSNPCCVKCYGIDMGTNRMALVGYPAGFMSSMSIGEPGTQLTMKNFQNGGVAGVTNLTSSFDTMDNYINMYRLRKEPSEPINYDYVSEVEGYVDTVSLGNGTKKLMIYKYNKEGKRVNKLLSNIILYEGIETKDYVRVGDSIQKVQGDLDVNELMERRSVEYAQKYLAVKLFDIFRNEVFVNLKHFEVLVASMTFYVCTKENAYFKFGHFYTVHEYYGHDRTGAEFFKTMKGVGQAPLFRNDVFSTIFMQDIKTGIERSIILSGKDEMELPITRYSFGLDIKMGSAVEGYLERRGNE